MRITVSAEEFRKAALRKRAGRGDEAEGSRKKPRSRSPLAPQAAPRPPTPPSAPGPSSAPSPSLPPRRSPTPTPPPRSPTPLPPPGPPAPMPPSEPTGQLAAAHTEELRATDAPPTTGSVPGEAPPLSRAAPADKKQKAVGSHGARGTASEPSGSKMGPVPSRPSVMNHPHLAEKLLSAASCPAIQEEMRRTNSRVVYREGRTAMLRVVNTFNHALAHVANEERRVDRYRREALENRDRAVKAEDALKFAQAGEAERHEIVRAQARAEASAAHQQMRNMLGRAIAAEGKFMAAEAELTEVKTQLETARSELKSAEERTEIAEEVARLADIRAAEATEAVKAADRKVVEAAEAMKAAARAAEGRMAEVAREAVENYRRSQVFVEEVADAGADAYLHGFYQCREEAVRVSGMESLRELEPEGGDPDAGGAKGDIASADRVASPSGPAPSKD